MYTKWWVKDTLSCERKDEKKKDSASELSLANVGGIFVVLAFGLIIAFLVAILEFFWIAKKPSFEQVLNQVFSF
jgi:ionotropic glutamate receptor